MPNTLHSTVLDASLLNIQQRASRIAVLSGSAATYDQAIAKILAAKSIDSTAFGSTQNGEVSGRRMLVRAVTAVPVTTGGVADHVAIFADSENVLLCLQELSTPQSVPAGKNINLGEWFIEKRDLSS